MRLFPFFLLTLASAHCADRPPNIVFILADDLGITDIGAYARHFTDAKEDELFFETPNLDKLVADGIAFCQSYANQLCSPTRAAILTGRIASRMGVTTATPNTKTYFNQGLNVPDGYDPHDVLEHKDPIKGKLPWINATSNTALDPSIPTWPRVLATHDCAFLGKWHLGGHGAADRQPGAFGFEELAYFDAGGSPYFKWQAQWDQTKPYFPTMTGRFKVGKSGKQGGLEYLTDDLGARAMEFLETRRAKEKPFVLYYCPFAVHTPFQAPPKDVKSFSSKKQLGHLGRDNATYAAMLKHLDESVGEIRATLEKTGLAKHTVLIFTSDNGGLSTSEGSPTSNLPLRGGKGWLYEGGIREPLVVRWPAVLKAGQTIDTPVCSPDFFATLADVAAAKVTAKIDGVSLRPLLEGQAALPERSLCWHYPHYGNQGGAPGAAIRRGDWKLIHWFENDRLELYNLRSDIGETTNLAEKEPQLVQSLSAELQVWQKEVGALMPTKNPAYDATKPNGRAAGNQGKGAKKKK